MKRFSYELTEVIGSIVVVALVAVVYLLSKTHADAVAQLAADFSAAAAVGVVALYLRHAQIMRAIESEEDRDKQLLTVVSEHLKRADRNVEILKHATHSVDVEDTAKVWLWNLTAVRAKYRAVNYQCKSAYCGTNDAALDMQRALIAGFNTDIDKVFIVESDEEIKDEWFELFEKEADAGIGVRVILKRDLHKKYDLKKDAERLHIDFDIFDDRLVMWWDCDDARCANQASLLMRESDVQDYSDFFDNLLSNATEWKAWKRKNPHGSTLGHSRQHDAQENR